MEGGPPIFKQDFSCPALLKDQNETLPIRGYHPLWLTFPGHSGYFQIGHWPGPRSLVTTNGVSVDVLSSSYLDISVRWVCLPCGINQYGLGFPIRKSADQSLLTAPHSLSQRVTSFVASLYQGIHQMLFKTLDRTVHESSNRSDNHYYSLKTYLEKDFKSTIRKLDNTKCSITLLFGIIFTNYFKQIEPFNVKTVSKINIY